MPQWICDIHNTAINLICGQIINCEFLSMAVIWNTINSVLKALFDVVYFVSKEQYALYHRPLGLLKINEVIFQIIKWRRYVMKPHNYLIMNEEFQIESTNMYDSHENCFSVQELYQVITWWRSCTVKQLNSIWKTASLVIKILSFLCLFFY